MTGIAVKTEAGKPLTSGQACLNRFTPEHVETHVAKGCGAGKHQSPGSLSFNTKLGKCGMHYERSETCIEKFRRTIA